MKGTPGPVGLEDRFMPGPRKIVPTVTDSLNTPQAPAPGELPRHEPGVSLRHTRAKGSRVSPTGPGPIRPARTSSGGSAASSHAGAG